MKVVQQQSHSVTNLDEALDMIAGWENIPGFITGYAVATSESAGDAPNKVVGLFEVTGDPRFAAGQRKAWVL